ncbi:MAG: hypothetical protein IPJ65_06860 [Archangiaceae bacterium]|nr:hypothetical protein [Archangiaceae bacterium]
MKCPSCNTTVADDAAVCPKCDHILDPSLFSDEPPKPKPGVKRSSTGTGAAKAVKRSPTGASGVKKAASGAKPAAPRRMMPDAPARRTRTPPEQRAEEEDWHSPKQPRVDPAMLAPPPSQVLDPEEAMADARNFMVALSLADRLAFWGACATLFACFLPWKDTAQEGESIGLLSLGALVFAANVVLIVAIIIRTRKVMPRLHALVPWLLQFGTSSFSIVWSLVLIKLAVNTQKARAMYGNEEVWMSKPGAGVILAVLTSIVALGGTLMGLREKPD